MLSYRFGTVNDFNWGFKPVLSHSKPHTFTTFIGEGKENEMHLLSLPGHIEYEQNDRKVKESTS